jgi:hypothetical protein
VILDSIEETFTELLSSCIGEGVSPFAEKYVVSVLVERANVPNADPRSLRLEDLLRRGLDSEGYIRAEYLRVTGDIALFVSGIFPDSFYTLSRKTAYDLGDYIDIGRTAYGNIDSEIFNEVSDRFPYIVDVLNEVSMRLGLTSHDVLKYLERRRLIDGRTTYR